MPATQHTLMISRRAAVVACLLAAVMAGCASPPAAGTGPASVARAELLLRQDNPAAAAQMFEQLAAGNPPPGRNDLVLSAARAWLAANRADDAQRVLDAYNTAMSQTQQFEHELLRGEVAIARGQYAPAWQQVSKIAAPLKPADASRLYLLQQQVALRAGQPVEAVRAGIERERVASTDGERNRARRDLLNDLRSAIDRGLRVDPAASRDALVSGWLEIAQIASAASRTPDAAPAQVERWRGRFPGHPAAAIAASEIIAPGERDAPRRGAAMLDASAVGLLLPLTGINAVAAGLIRDGFMAAVGRMPEAGRPVVRIYDTGAMSVSAAIQSARTEGARMLVGPLTRPEVQDAAGQRPSDMPILLLNNLTGSGFAGANLYQYALAPEDEARQIARQMAGAGQRNAMVLAPGNDWGNRVTAAFTEELTRAGGQVVAQGRYDSASGDLQANVEAVLGIEESRNRYQKLKSLIGEFGFEPRPRPDIDAIFVAGYTDSATVNPILRIYPFLNKHAPGLPVFMTRDGLEADANANRDLLGISVLDTPWMLEASGPSADLRASTESIWSARGVLQSRYFAFGFDAATLALAIRTPSTQWPLNGLTGRLSLTPEGRVERSLQWARVGNGGVVQPADPAAR